MASRSPLVERTIHRTVADQYAAAAGEIERIIEATYRVIEREGTVDPSMRAILAEAGLSTQGFYRHFRSKDELMLVLLDDGRRRLAGYLEHQMAKAADPIEAVRAWIRGTLLQAQDAKAADRTRPFARSMARLQERYPDEHRESVDVLVGLLNGAIEAAIAAGAAQTLTPAYDATFIYLYVQGIQDRHLREETKPTSDEVDQAVSFALRAILFRPKP
jgi:AcrR family transcriptional regulator